MFHNGCSIGFNTYSILKGPQIIQLKNKYERSGFCFDIEATADNTSLRNFRNTVRMHAK